MCRAQLAWWLRGELARHPERLRIVVKHFPLPYHRDADAAHRAVLAAAAQGRFWEMHDLLFTRPAAVDEGRILAAADQLGLDAARFAVDRASPAVAARIAADIVEGKARGVRGVPTLFVGGERLDGIPDPARWAALLSAARGADDKAIGPAAAEAGRDQTLRNSN